MLRLYDYWESGNCYKVRLLLSQLGETFERVDVDILEGETRTPEFLAKNPNHRVPVVEWPDGRTLAESNAILFYLAEGSPFLPSDPWQRAQVLQWQAFEQYSHEPYIAVVRFWHFVKKLEENQHLLPAKMEGGYHALDVMEKHLSGQDFFVGGDYSIADISLYAYTHVADEGGFDLEPYPNTRAWIARVRAQPRYIGLTDAVGVRLSKFSDLLES
jgi:glutathione S-transferase